MHKEPKVILRVYFTPDERDALKQIAEEQNSSLSELIATATRKQYKLGKKKKVRQVNASLLDNTEVSSNGQLDAGCDLSADGEQVSLDAPSLTSSTGVDDVVLESVETHSSDVEITVTPEVDTTAPEVANIDNGTEQYDFDALLLRGSEPHLFNKKERKAMKRRITEINNTIDGAKANNNLLPRDEYYKLVEQKNKLKKIVYPNDNQ